MPKEATFSARARVVDLLGREQIADAPTAVSELLKNAIDAAANNAKIDFSSAHGRLIIQDNGLGMRTHDVLHRWLVLATESKRQEPDQDWLACANQRQKDAVLKHSPLGEKGIGRLAVSALGRAVIVWSRWCTGKTAEGTLLLVHWDVFRHPRLGLDQIMLPYKKIADGAPSPADLESLISQQSDWLTKNRNHWKTESEKKTAASIQNDLEEVFPKALEGLTFSDDPGTTFIVLGTTPEVEELFKSEVVRKDDIEVSEGLKLLFGFCDPFSIDKQRIKVDFLVDGKPPKAGDDFWEPKDFAKADHEINLNFSENGHVTGTARKFKQPFNYEYQSTHEPRTEFPGAFTLHLGYVEGEQSSSRLSPEEHTAYSERLKAFGALYVYRDGVRVLPYGRTDNDFLGFEERRSRNAGRYFFSHRRMFGAIYLDSKENSRLKDKAGREGFIRNGAYRGFVRMLQDVFIDLSRAHFGSDAGREDKDSSKRRKGADAARARAKKAKAEFLRDLEKWARRLPVLEDEFKTALKALSAEINEAAESKKISLEIVTRLNDSISSLQNIRKTALDELGTEPSPIVRLNSSQHEAFDSYLTNRQQFEENTLASFSNLCTKFAQIASKVQSQRDRLTAIRDAIDTASKEQREALDAATDEFGTLAKKIISDGVPSWKKEHLEELAEIAKKKLGTLDPAVIAADAEKVAALPGAISDQQRLLRETVLPFWKLATMQLENLQTSEASELELGTLNRALERLEERSKNFAELAQLGLIVESLDHEYNVLFTNLRSDLKHLIPHQNSEAAPIMTHLQSSFESLEAKLRFLSPLYRRRLGGKGDLTGGEIQSFIEKLYSENKREGTIFTYSDKFLEMKLHEVNKPVVLAGTANLVANSLYWTTRSDAKREIRFSIVRHGFVVSDSGPGVAPRDREQIFEPFFGRRPMGRGLGLYITRTNFEANGLRISVADERQKNALSGANFIITKDTDAEPE